MIPNEWIGPLCVGGGVAVCAYRLWRKSKMRPATRAADTAKPAPSPDLIPGLLTLHQAYEGVLVMGGTGSGKTTGPGAYMREGLLRSGAGMCILTAKPDEAAMWDKACREANRECVRFAPGSGWCCDVLNEDISHPDGTVESTAQLLDTLVEVSSRQSGKGDEPFWKLGAQKTFRKAIGAVWYATGTCSLVDVYRLIASAPENAEQLKDDGWRKRSYCADCILQGAQRMQVIPEIERDFNLCADFWLTEWPNLSEKTRSIFYTMTTNVLDKFLSGPVMDMVSSGKSNITPQHIMDGAVVVLDMPVLKWREPGQFFQVIFKTLVQRAVLRRENPERPVVIWADEAQFFVVPELDGMTQTVARQAKLISVVLTQNLPMLYAAMGGGEQARQQADGWMSNLQTKILCANACKQTNEFFSELLGSSKHLFMNGSTQHGDFDPVADMMGNSNGSKASGGFSEQWHPDVPPGAFTKLRKGGADNGFTVEAFVFQGGRVYRNGKTWVKTEFKQRV